MFLLVSLSKIFPLLLGIRPPYLHKTTFLLYYFIGILSNLSHIFNIYIHLYIIILNILCKEKTLIIDFNSIIRAFIYYFFIVNFTDFSSSVYGSYTVIVTDPSETPVTIPLESTTAIESSLEVYSKPFT